MSAVNVCVCARTLCFRTKLKMTLNMNKKVKWQWFDPVSRKTHGRERDKF